MSSKPRRSPRSAPGPRRSRDARSSPSRRRCCRSPARPRRPRRRGSEWSRSACEKPVEERRRPRRRDADHDHLLLDRQRVVGETRADPLLDRMIREGGAEECERRHEEERGPPRADRPQRMGIPITAPVVGAPMLQAKPIARMMRSAVTSARGRTSLSSVWPSEPRTVSSHGLRVATGATPAFTTGSTSPSRRPRRRAP